jgi:hypothetical protein
MRNRGPRAKLRVVWSAALAFLVMCTTAIAGDVPILGKPTGPLARYERGYGHVRPTTIYNGGDASGEIREIRWSSWGGSRAIGEGLGLWIGPNQHTFEGVRERARVVASRLGYCHGRRAYNAVEWYFPQHGERFSATRALPACSP